MALVVKNPLANTNRPKRHRFDPWVGKIPWRRAQEPIPVFLPGESHGERNLMGYSSWGHKESDMTEETWRACITVSGLHFTFADILLFLCLAWFPELFWVFPSNPVCTFWGLLGHNLEKWNVEVIPGLKCPVYQAIKLLLPQVKSQM